MLGLFDRYLILSQAHSPEFRSELPGARPRADSFVLDWALEELEAEHLNPELEEKSPVGVSGRFESWDR